MKKNILLILIALSIAMLVVFNALSEEKANNFDTRTDFILANFTMEEIERYEHICEAGINTVHTEFAAGLPTIESSYDPNGDNDLSNSQGKHIIGLPRENEISRIDALFVSYKALERELDFSEEHLSLYYPTFLFFAVHPSGQRVYYVNLSSYTRSMKETGGNYFIEVDAANGDIIKIHLPDEAEG